MKESRSIFTALILTGILGLSASPVQSQSKPDDPSGPGGSKGGQREQGSQSGRSGGMKSGDVGRPPDPGDRIPSAKQGGQWGKEDIKKVQEALKDKGTDPGPVDGLMGPQTQKAIREFQQKEGLKTTGRLDAETAKALGVESGSTSMDKGSSSMDKGSSDKGSSSESPSRSKGQKPDSGNK